VGLFEVRYWRCGWEVLFDLSQDGMNLIPSTLNQEAGCILHRLIFDRNRVEERLIIII